MDKGKPMNKFEKERNELFIIVIVIITVALRYYVCFEHGLLPGNERASVFFFFPAWVLKLDTMIGRYER